MAKKKKKKRTQAPPAPVRKAAVRREPDRASGQTAGRSVPGERSAKARPSKVDVGAQVRREALRRKILAGALVLLAVAAVSTYIVLDRRGDSELEAALTGGSCTTDTEADPIGGGDGHVDNPTYQVEPPAGGQHLPSAAKAGVYSGTGVPEDGLLVHALEHGYVIAWHPADLEPAALKQLTDFQAAHEGDVILAERPQQTMPVVATAWGQRLLCGQVEPAALERFAEQYIGKGPENVQRG